MASLAIETAEDPFAQHQQKPKEIAAQWVEVKPIANDAAFIADFKHAERRR